MLNNIIHPDQACGVKGRNMTSHLYLIDFLTQYIENDGNLREGLILLGLDQEKAFDRVEPDYIINVLHRNGFDNNFTRWVQTMYKNIYSKVNVNGILTEKFLVTRSMRQGCPLSMLLFVIGLEPYLTNIRNNNKFKGYRFPNGKYQKYISYADDITFFIQNKNDWDEIFEEFTKYSKVSGAKLNIDKTEMYAIGIQDETAMDREYYTKSYEQNVSS